MGNEIDKQYKFTLDNYSLLLKNMKNQYSFIDFSRANDCSSPSILMRHDVDLSVHNAYEMAKIENDLGICSTYFFLLRNWFYDLREFEIYSLAKHIHNLGHEIALHFDFEYFPGQAITSYEHFLKSLERQKNELQDILDLEIKTYSMHMPTSIDAGLFSLIKKHDTHLGMINTYADSITKKFKYCSDSNGVWRFDKLDDLIDPEEFQYLHILLHPEWWTKRLLTPRQKVERALQGRAKAMLRNFDELMITFDHPYF